MDKTTLRVGRASSVRMRKRLRRMKRSRRKKRQ